MRTDVTDDGYILDRGFAVFVEDYPTSNMLLDYDALGLKRFEPGAMVRLPGGENGGGGGNGNGNGRFASVYDPRRRPGALIGALFSPICGPFDKLKLVPLFLTVLTKNIEELFDMDEVDARSCLTKTYGLSDDFVNSFFAPFLEGIYLAPLEHISSRMVHFLLKMFAGGYASLPRGGMGAVVDQLEDRAAMLGIDMAFGSRVASIVAADGRKDVGGLDGGGGERGGFVVEVDSREGQPTRIVRARSVVVATDVDAARRLLGDDTNGLLGDGSRTTPNAGTSSSPPPSPPPPPPPSAGSTSPPRRSVGCVYYGFASPSPVLDPILIMNGEGGGGGGGGVGVVVGGEGRLGDPPSYRRNTEEHPINNVCFPSRVQASYAPDGCELCSVSVLEGALEGHRGDVDSIDASVRRQLATWFPGHANDILDETKWVRKGAYVIDNAQPANYHRRRGDGDDRDGDDHGNAAAAAAADGGWCANVHGGRECSAFRGSRLPGGVFVCGDHMATSTLNGAMESGLKAGHAAGRYLAML